MPIADSRVPNGVGFLPLQHKGYDRDEFDLDMRGSMLAVRIEGRDDTGATGLGDWIYERGSVGDVVGAFMWPAASRPIPGWSWVWPVRLVGGGGRQNVPTRGGGGRPPVPSEDNRPDTASGGGTAGGGASGDPGALGAAGIGGGAGGGSNPRPGEDPGRLIVGIGGPNIIPRGNLNPFSFGGSSSAAALSGIPGVGFGGGGIGFQFSGGNSTANLSGIPGIGFSSGFAGFQDRPDPYRNPYGNRGTQLGNVFGNTGRVPPPPGSLFGRNVPGGGAAGGGANGPAGGFGAVGPPGPGQDVPGMEQGRGGAGKSCGMFGGNSSHSMLPCNGEGFAPDDRYAPIKPNIPEGFPTLTASTVGLAVTATNEERQVEYFFPTDPRLIAVNAAGDPKMGSLVCDLNGSFEIDSNRTAPLQSAFRVIRKALNGTNAIALQISDSGCADSDGGYFIGQQITGGGAIAQVVDKSDTRVIGYASRTKGGPYDVGTTSDKHYLGEDADGNRINMLHWGTNTLFRRDDVEDGPLRFEHEYKEGQEGPIPVYVRLGWTGADWAWWTTTNESPC